MPSLSLNDLSVSGSTIQKTETAVAARDRAFNIQNKSEMHLFVKV